MESITKPHKISIEINLKYMNQGFDFYLIPITIEQYKVGPEDRHLNEHATDQVMKDLAIRMESLVLPSR